MRAPHVVNGRDCCRNNNYFITIIIDTFYVYVCIQVVVMRVCYDETMCIHIIMSRIFRNGNFDIIIFPFDEPFVSSYRYKRYAYDETLARGQHKLAQLLVDECREKNNLNTFSTDYLLITHSRRTYEYGGEGKGEKLH